MPTKRAKSLIKYAEEFGFKVERINKHVILKHSNGATISIACSPGDLRGDLNKKAEIRRLSKSPHPCFPRKVGKTDL